MYLDVLLKIVGSIANVLNGIVTCDIVLTNMHGVGNVEIWLTCKEMVQDPILQWTGVLGVNEIG